MHTEPIRPAAVAGEWYPDQPARLTAAVDRYLADVATPLREGTLLGLVAPHAGLIYSGPVAAWAYRAVEGRRPEAIVLVGPSHRVAFDGVALFARGAFDTPLGPLRIDEELAAALLDATPVVRENPRPHRLEHSLEMQLPFLKRLQPDTPIVPMLMGDQDEPTVRALGEALGRVLAGRRVLLVASSDLSHYLDRRSAAAKDAAVLQHVERFDAEGLLAALRRNPDHACGGGPIVSVMLACQALGASSSRILRYADSGDVSGDTSAVVGYMAAAFGRFERDERNDDAQ